MQQWERLVAKTMARTGLSRADAEDVVQDVTERVLAEGLSADVTDWFYYVAESAKNRATDEYRRARAAERRAAKVPRAAWLSAVPSDDVAEAVVARLDLDAAYDAVDTLPELTAQVFLLRVLDGLKPRQIEERLGLTSNQVEYRLEDAKKRLFVLQERRRATKAFALLAVLLRPVRKSGVGSTTPGVVVAASAAALSVLTVLAVPGPRALVGSQSLRVPVLGGPALGASPAREGTGTRRDAGHPPGDAATPTPARPAPRPAGGRGGVIGRLTEVGGCVGPACVTTGGDRLPGDVISLRRAPNVRVSQRLIETCWAIPDNPEVECRSDDPSAYEIPRPEAPPAQPEQVPEGAGGKSTPSAPGTREPSKGTTT